MYIIAEPGVDHATAENFAEALRFIQGWHVYDHDAGEGAQQCTRLWEEAVEALPAEDFTEDHHGLQAYADALMRHIGSQSCFGGSPSLTVSREA